MSRRFAKGVYLVDLVTTSGVKAVIDISHKNKG